MTRTLPAFLLACTALAAAPALASAEVEVTLSGSRASMLRQNRVAKQEDFSFLRTPTQVRRFVDDGRLVVLEGNADYALANVGYPYARPVVQAFVERLAGHYREACGERLVVTSLTRPTTRQPRNASPLSVHPAGMAVDLRVSSRAGCRSWLSGQLLELEELGLIDATLERSPPHYHIAVFPNAYADYEHVIRTDSANAAAVAAAELASRQAAYLAAALVLPQVVETVSEVKPPLVLRLAGLVARLVLPVLA